MIQTSIQTRLLSSLKNIQPLPLEASKFEFNVIVILQIVFYIIFIIKIINISFFRGKKLTVKQRINKKYRFSYKEIIQSMNQKDYLLMINTLNNTIKNAYLENSFKQKERSNKKKSVTFCQRKNQYYEPKNHHNINNMQDQQNDQLDEEQEDSQHNLIQDEETRLYSGQINTVNTPKIIKIVDQSTKMKVQFKSMQTLRFTSLLDHEQQQQPFNHQLIQSLNGTLQELQQKLHEFPYQNTMHHCMSDKLTNI